MKWTALLAVAALFLVAGQATAAPKTVKGVVVAKRAHGRTIVVATGRNGLAVTVRVTPRRVRLGDRVSVVGSRVHVISHVRRTRLRAVVVKRLAHALRVASGHSVLTIHTRSRALASHGDGVQKGDIGEFEVEFKADGMHEDDFTAAAPAGTVQIEGTLVSVSPLVVSLEGLSIEITVPNGVTLPPLTPGQEVELIVQTGAGNTFTLVSIEQGNNEDEDQGEVEAKGPVTDSTTSQITVDAGGASITFAAPAGTTLPVVAQGTFVEARGVTINGVLTLTRLKVEDCDSGDGSGQSGPSDDGCGD
jgi:FtsP/CotA-like multicopper oxidase with cupredoxin domain